MSLVPKLIDRYICQQGKLTLSIINRVFTVTQQVKSPLEMPVYHILVPSSNPSYSRVVTELPTIANLKAGNHGQRTWFPTT